MLNGISSSNLSYNAPFKRFRERKEEEQQQHQQKQQQKQQQQQQQQQQIGPMHLVNGLPYPSFHVFLLSDPSPRKSAVKKSPRHYGPQQKNKHKRASE